MMFMVSGRSVFSGVKEAIMSFSMLTDIQHTFGDIIDIQSFKNNLMGVYRQ